MQVPMTISPPGMPAISFSVDAAKIGGGVGSLMVQVGTEMQKPTFNWQAFLAAVAPFVAALMSGNWAAVFAALPALVAAIFGTAHSYYASATSLASPFGA